MCALLPSFFFFHRRLMKSLSGGPFLCLGLVRGRVALRGKIFSSAAEKKFSRRKPPSSLSFPHTFFRFCCVILVYTPVYIKPPHEDANFHTGFISNNFKKMSTTTANPPASAAATKGTRDEFCVFTRIIEIIFGRSLGAFLRRKIVFLLLGDGKEGEMWG